MRIIVFFDLPTTTHKDKRAYILFRRHLLKNGFVMMQFSVYSRICKGQDSLASRLKYLRTIAPNKGNIRVLQVTEKQFARMEVLIGAMKKEHQQAGNQMLLF